MPTMPSISSAKPWTPRDYQLDAAQFLLEHACAGLLLDPGLGKTASTLAAISFLRKRGLINKVLIIAPLRPVYVVWPKEIKKWEDFNHLTIEILHGPGKDAALKREADIYVINPEGLDWLLGTTKTKHGNRLSVGVDMKRWKALGFDVLVVDELSKFKHTNTGRFKALKQVLHTFGRRWGLTGSPAANGLMDLFGQMFVLDMGNALGRYITHFRETYFIPDKYGYNWTLMPGAAERIYERIEPLCLRMGRDFLNMPKLVENDILVQLPPEVMRFYEQIEKDFIAGLDDRTITAVNAAAASTKLRQIAAGGVFLDPKLLPSGLRATGKREWSNLHGEKINALRDLVDELQGSPLLVAYDFEHDLDRLRGAFKDGVFACDYSMKSFPELERRWNEGKIPVLFAHPQSLGHGLNMQEKAQHVCWHSLTWNLELYEQFIDRVFRQGNPFDHVYVHRIIAEDTIDEVMVRSLAAKEFGQNALFNGIRDMAALRRGAA